MLIKGLQGKIDGHTVNITFPDKKSIILKNRNALEIMFLMEKLMSSDVTDYYTTLDKNKYGIDYKDIDDEAQLVFSDGLIFSNNQATHIKGTIPKLHIIRYLKDDIFRSIIVGEDKQDAKSVIYTNMTKYSNVLSMQAWNRLALKVKEVLGFDFCEVGRNSLKFNRQEGTNGWTLKAQDLVYNMLAECFLTPENVARIVLLPNLDKIMETKQQISFIEALDDIKGHSLVLANTNVTFNDIKKGSAISVIS